MLDLDVSTYLVQNCKLAEALAIGTNERVRGPRKPLTGEVRARAEKIVRDAIATRPRNCRRTDGAAVDEGAVAHIRRP